MEFKIDALRTFVIIILFIVGPVRSVIIQIRDLTFVKASTDRIIEFESFLEKKEKVISNVKAPDSFDSLEFFDICFEYLQDKKVYIVR